MGAHLRSKERDLLDSLWFIPTVITVLYAILALLLLRADKVLGLETQGQDAWAVGGAEGARGVLFAVAGTTLTVLTVVFTLTVVVLQIAAVQFTPRILRTLTGDRGTQVVLGVFFGTITYALLVLRAVRSPGEDAGGPGFVPVAAVTVAIVLALVSIAFMIYYINRVARSVQVAVIIERVTHNTLALLDEPLAAGGVALRSPAGGEWVAPAESAATIGCGPTGYLQAIDAEALLATADAHRLFIRNDALVGTFLLAGAPLATIWPATTVDDEIADAIRTAFVLGPERTQQQDDELGIRQLADIAIRAMSAAVNDPTTTVLCIDRLGQLLVRAAERPEAEGLAGSHGGRVVLRGPSFARLVAVAFAQIRRYGAGDPVVAHHLMVTLGEVAARVPVAQREPLRNQAIALLAEARHALEVESDVLHVEAAATWTLAETAAHPVDR